MTGTDIHEANCNSSSLDGVWVDLALNSESEIGETAGVGYVSVIGCPDDE